MDNYNKLLQMTLQIQKQMDWKKYHNIKDLSIAISTEANELLEHSLWIKDDNEVNIDELKYEIADVYIYLIQLCQHLELDINELAIEKQQINILRLLKTLKTNYLVGF